MGHRILVAEDSRTQAERLRLLLTEAGYEVELAEDGEVALDKILAAAPDLVISDVVMPNMDGYALCRALRSREETKGIPFVLVTSQSGPEDIIRGLEHGADNFIVKPYEDADLLNRIERIFEHLSLRESETLGVDLTLALGGRPVTITADKQQIVELLFATAERLGRVNAELERSEQALQEHVDQLEARVQERTRDLNESLESLRRLDAERRQLLSRLLNAQEEERRLIANDLHDDSVQVMVAVGMELGVLGRHAGPELADRVRELEGVVGASISRLRRLMFELSPPTLNRAGLTAALRELLEDLHERAGIEFVLHGELAEEPPMEVRTVLYRIAREALTNVRKHAQAHRIDVHVLRSQNGALVRVRDDGAGFPPEQGTESPNGHLGLTSMRERAEMAGGWWRVDTAPGRGTLVEFWLPWETG